jgi:hypothetical protein
VGTWKRRLRAAIAIGAVWGAAWFAAGMVLLAIVGLHAADVPFPLFFGALGFGAGAIFSLLLPLLTRSRKLEDMSLAKFAMTGAVGGVALATIVNAAAGPSNEMLGLSLLFAGAGATSAAGTLALARRTAQREVA